MVGQTPLQSRDLEHVSQDAQLPAHTGVANPPQTIIPIAGHLWRRDLRRV